MKSNKYNLSKKEFIEEITKLLSVEDIRVATILADISSAITNVRKQKSMNQKDFSDYMQVSQSMISKWESGDYNFTIESMVHVFDKLDIDFEVLIGDAATEYCHEEDETQGWSVNQRFVNFPRPLAV